MTPTTERPSTWGVYWVRCPNSSNVLLRTWRPVHVEWLDDATCNSGLWATDRPAGMWNLTDSHWDGAEWFGPLPGPDDPWPTVNPAADADHHRLDFLAKMSAEITYGERSDEPWHVVVWTKEEGGYEGYADTLRAAIDEAMNMAEEDTTADRSHWEEDDDGPIND